MIKNRQAGFTLVEIAIAVAILGLAFATLISLHTKMLNAYGIERNRNIAATIGQYVFAMIEVSPTPPEVGTDAGKLKSKLQDYNFFETDTNQWKLEDDIDDWEYSLTVTSLGLLDLEDVYRKIDLKISWGEGDDENFDLVYLVFTKSYTSGGTSGILGVGAGGGIAGGGTNGGGTTGGLGTNGGGAAVAGGGIAGGGTTGGGINSGNQGSNQQNPYQDLLNAN